MREGLLQLLHPFLEPGQSPHQCDLFPELGRGLRGTAHVEGAACQAFAYPGLRRNHRIIPDLQMPRHPDLTGKRHPLSQPGATRNPSLGHQKGVLTYYRIVRDLHKIVYLAPFLNPSSPESGAVHRRVRTNFNIIVDLHDSDLRDLYVPPPTPLEPKAVAPEHHARMKDHAVSNHAPRGNGHSWMQKTLLPDSGLLSNITVGAHHGTRTHHGARFQNGEGLDRHALAKTDARTNKRSRVNTGGERQRSRCKKFNESGESKRGV